MKVRKVWFVVIVSMLIMISLACEKLVEKVTTKDINITKQVFSGSVSGDTETLLIATDKVIGSGGFGLTKPTASNFIEAPMPIPDLALLAAIITTGGGTFSGTLVNNADNEVVFGIYFGNATALPQPKTVAARIATLTLPALATVSISSQHDFDQAPNEILLAMLNFFLANPGIETVYVYLTGDGEPTVNVTVQTMSFIMPPAFHIKRTIVPGDLSNYSDKVKEVKNGQMTGTITNNGADNVDFSAFVSLVTGDFVHGNPAESDSVAFINIPVTNTIDLANTPSFFVKGGAGKLDTGIDDLLHGKTIEVNLFFISSMPISLQVDELALKGTATVSL